MRILFTVLTLCAVFSGCHTTPEYCDNCVDKVWPPKSTDRVGVIVACTKVDPKAYNGWNGACPGCDVDANFVASQMVKEQIPYALLFNQKATSENVISTARQATQSLKDGGLLFLYFSGHGGQLTQAQAGNETDGKDETICLYDGQLRDDIVWRLLTSIDPSRNIKVFMVTDCCNSGSNFRTPHNYARSLPRSYLNIPTPKGPRAIPNLCHWGGCGDSESSYGSAYGGSFTMTWKKALAKGLTYRQTQSFISSNISGQRPVYATLGNFDLDKKVFSK